MGHTHFGATTRGKISSSWSEQLTTLTTDHDMLRTFKRSTGISIQTQPPVQVYADVVLKSSKEIVHLEYTPSKLPPKPSEEWTRFVCISDTHSRTFEVPTGDVLLHSGDLTNTGTVKDFEKTMDWLYSLPHKTKM